MMDKDKLMYPGRGPVRSSSSSSSSSNNSSSNNLPTSPPLPRSPSPLLLLPSPLLLQELSAREVERREAAEIERRKQQKTEARRAKKRANKSLRRDDVLSPYAYTVSSERAFFDHVRSVLMETKPESWNDFIRLLSMYTNDIIPRKDMLSLVQDLLGRQTELFDEFKCILNARMATDAAQNDLWYSMPLSEIDFSQCRKCTPSYRALPKDYPKPPCTERSPEEEAVLNDTWVSVPVGSEENYSFKHMRRNIYEVGSTR